MQNQELTDAYRQTLAQLAEDQGYQLAIEAAAITLAYYVTRQSAGFDRSAKPMVIVPNGEHLSKGPD